MLQYADLRLVGTIFAEQIYFKNLKLLQILNNEKNTKYVRRLCLFVTAIQFINSAIGVKT